MMSIMSSTEYEVLFIKVFPPILHLQLIQLHHKPLLLQHHFEVGAGADVAVAARCAVGACLLLNTSSRCS